MQSFDEYKLRHIKYDNKIASHKLSNNAEVLMMVVNNMENGNVFNNLCSKMLKDNLLELIYVGNYYNDNGRKDIADVLFNITAEYSRKIHPELWKRFHY